MMKLSMSLVRWAIVCATLLCAPLITNAQSRAIGEIGISVCSFYGSGSGQDREIFLDIPGRGIPWKRHVRFDDPAPVPVYVSLFPISSIMLEPRIRYRVDFDERWLDFGGQVAYLFTSTKSNTRYVALNLLYSKWWQVDGLWESDYRLGIGIGHRLFISRLFSSRIEVSYNKWQGSEIRVFGLNIVLGVVIYDG